MNFIHYKVTAQTGNIVEVTKDSDCNVHLLDPMNFSKYKVGRPFSGQGGLNREKVVEFGVPYKGVWHVVLDLKGLPFSQVRASVKVKR